MKAILVVAATAAACTSAPATPTWQADVLPIVASNCVRCHGAVPEFGAPRSFRLDVLEDASTDPLTGMPIHGAQTMYYRMRDRVDDGSMPPKLPLVGDSVDVIDNWFAEAQGSSVVTASYASPTPRGAERPGNRAPTLSLTPTGAPDTYAYAIADADRDLVEGRLTIGGAVVASGLRSGTGTVTLDLSAVRTPGAQPLDAVLDDGALHPLPALFTVTVPDARITVSYPQPTDLITKDDPRGVELCADRPGTIASVVAIDARGVHDPVTLATAVAIGPCTGPATTVDWSAWKGGLADAVSTWRLEITTADATPVVVRTPIFRVVHTDAPAAFADVKSILADKCGSLCHHTCGSYPATLPYDFDVYEASDLSGKSCGAFLGAGERGEARPDVGTPFNPGWIYERVIVREDMPPLWAPPLTTDERAAIDAWLLGGAKP
jgi:hypothetical protein